MAFSEKYISLCAENKENPTALAEQLGFSRATGSKWCKGAVPRPATLRIIADHFHVNVEDLLAETENPAPIKGNGLNKEYEEWVNAWEAATPEARHAALAVLRLQGRSLEDRD